MAKKNRKCITCGEKYSYCPNCNRKAPYWMTEFHAENCKNIFQICTEYNVGLKTKEQAQEALNACDLSNKESFVECIQRDFVNIFAVEEQPKKRGKRAEMPIIDETIPEVILEEVFEVIQDEVAPVEQMHVVVETEE